MSTDQNLLYRSCQAIISGICPPSLAKRKIGGICHARWLTLAIRINFLYMSMPIPSPALFRLATFVVTVYSYLWFRSKISWKATEAPTIVFEAMKLIYALPAEERKIISPVFERGFFWGHSEQLLLGCLASPDVSVRALAVSRIFKLRKCQTSQSSTQKGKGNKRKGNSNVRIFNIPKPVYEANHFSKMINWKTEQITVPPYLRSYTDEQIRKFLSEPLVIAIPSNSQHVERYIQLIAKNSTRASSSKLRDGLCKATIKN